MRIRNLVWFVLVALVLLSASLPGASAQRQLPGDQQQDPFEKEQMRRMEKTRNEDRQKQLKRDTQKLLELATELKQYVDRTNESVLSIEVIRKTEEIEKLAKNVRNRMKGQ
jgi:hypothetical protein